MTIDEQSVSAIMPMRSLVTSGPSLPPMIGFGSFSQRKRLDHHAAFNDCLIA
jgi:hypothetical protein